MKWKANPLVAVLVACFGSASWIAVNALWVEMPIIVYQVPEQWTLPSFLAVIVQIASIGPLVYGFLDKFCQGFSDRFRDPVIIATQLAGIAGTVGMAFVWDRTMFVAGGPRSGHLFVMAFLASLAACTSNVTFLPYMGNFKSSYIIPFFVGMGCSALIPSLLSLAQGAGAQICVLNSTTNETFPMALPPRFGFGGFLVVIACCLVASLAAFLILTYLPAAKSEKIDNHRSSPGAVKDTNEGVKTEKMDFKSPDDTKGKPKAVLSPPHYFSAILITGWVCALMNGILPSIQAYSCMPYGQTTYHYAVVLSNLANPIACFLPFFISVKRPSVIWVLSFCTTAVSAYCMVTAALSPNPPLRGALTGKIIVIACWMLAIGLCAYVRTILAEAVRSDAAARPRGLFWLGAATQAGSFMGAVTMFPMISVYGLFKSAAPC